MHILSEEFPQHIKSMWQISGGKNVYEQPMIGGFVSLTFKSFAEIKYFLIVYAFIFPFSRSAWEQAYFWKRERNTFLSLGMAELGQVSQPVLSE